MSRVSLKNDPKKLIIISVIILVVVIYLIVLFGKIRTKRELDARESEMQTEVSSILEDNSKIKESIENGDNESYLEEIARSEYSYVNPEERVYYDNDAA